MDSSETNLTFNDPCVIFALHREAGRFLREFRPQQRFAGAPCWARFCGPSWLSVLVLVTGVGKERARWAIDWVLGAPMLKDIAYQPKCVLTVGFSGALDPHRKVGDVILASEVADASGRTWPNTWPGELPAGEWQPALHRGRVLTVESLVADPALKESLGREHTAIAVDMESAIVAEACARKDMPFGCVRSISDEMTMSLSPQLVSILSSGQPSVPRLLQAVVSAPRLMGEMRQLARHTRTAADQLGKALGELLTLTLPWGRNL
jgi:adenosylhomocysteine nucleosidase